MARFRARLFSWGTKSFTTEVTEGHKGALGEKLVTLRTENWELTAECAIVTDMAFQRPKRRTYSEDELYEYAVGALARRMRTVAELKRMMRARIEEAESEYGQKIGRAHV